MTLLLDTCVISESTKARGDPAVAAWLAAQIPSQLCISAITVGELHFGARTVPEGKRRRNLEDWVASVERDFAGRIVPFDEAAAAIWGGLRADYSNLQLVDGQIAATALAYGLIIVTRNVKDFAFPGLSVFNPWSK